MKLRDHDLLTRLLRTRPILAVSGFYAIGCLIGSMISISATVCIAVGAAVMIPVFIPFGRRFRAMSITVAFLFFGIANFSLQWKYLSPVTPQASAAISGTVCTKPVYKASTDRLILLLEDVTIDGEHTNGKLRVYMRNDDEPEQLLNSIPDIGCKITTEGRIWKADSATNPGQFDFSSYLRINGITGYATVKQQDTQYGETILSISNLPARIRSSLSVRIDRLFPNESALAKAFLLGDRSEINEDDREAFSAAGIAHLLAISGMHISLLSYAGMMLLNRFLARKHAFMITFTLLFLYSVLIGFPASLMRALIMFGVGGFARLTGYRSDPPTTLALSMLICLLISPAQILSTGFALSYGATAGIILLNQPVTALLHAENLVRMSSHKDNIPVYLRIASYLVQTLIVTLSAQLAILPIVIYSFGAQSILSFFTGLVAVPIAMIGYLLSIIALITGIPVVCVSSDFLFTVLSKIAHIASGLPISTIRIARFPAWITLLWSITCILSSGLSLIHIKIRRFLPLLIIPAALIANLTAYLDSLPTTVMFMDAGQADCAVIRSHGKVYLVDTGDDYSPVADYLTAMNYSVDAVFLSHPHADHTGGLNSILELCTPKTIYMSANYRSYNVDENVLAILDHCVAAGSEIIELSAGSIVSLSEDCSIEVLHPSAGFQTTSANEDSMLLSLTCGESSVLFTGDAPAETIMNNAKDADILKVAHHGAKDSVNEALLEAVSPSACIISVGYNSYGHPKETTLDLISLTGAPVFRTDYCGAITCQLDMTGRISIHTYIKQENNHDSK